MLDSRKKKTTTMTKEEIFEMFDRYDAYETLNTGETVQVIHWHDLKHIAEEIIKNCSIPDDVKRELLLSYSEWWDSRYSPRRSDFHRNKDIDRFLSQ